MLKKKFKQLGLLAFISVAGYIVYNTFWNADNRRNVLGDSKVYENVRNSTTTIISRIGPHETERGTIATDYPQLGDEISLSEEQLHKLSSLLTNKESYGWNYAKPCIPTPGVRVRFSHAGEDVYVLL